MWCGELKPKIDEELVSRALPCQFISSSQQQFSLHSRLIEQLKVCESLSWLSLHTSYFFLPTYSLVQVCSCGLQLLLFSWGCIGKWTVEPLTELANIGEEQTFWRKLVCFILAMKSDQVSVDHSSRDTQSFLEYTDWRLGMRSRLKVQIWQ